MSLADPNSYPSPVERVAETELDQLLYARHTEVKNIEDLMFQRGTPIPALFNQFYKFVQNPSTVSVETFKRMIDTDDTLGSGIDFLTTCLAARLGRYTHPSAEVTKWVNQALDGLVGGFGNALKELLGATWAGFAVQEKVWENNEELGFVVKKLVSLPPGTLMFETERTGEFTPDGILQYQRNYNPASLTNGAGYLYGFNSGNGRNDPFAKLGDLPFPLRTANTYSYLSIRIPVQKCLHFAFDAQGKFGNPYGRSLLRRAYKWYVMKDAFLQMLSVALDRKGTPLTIVYADPNTTLLDDSKVSPGQNMAGRRDVGIKADAAARKAFANIHNDTTIILPGRKDQVFSTDFVPQTSNAADFMAAIDLCNKSMMRAMLVPSLIFGNGDGTGSYSLGQEHAKTFDKILDGMLSGVKETLKTQLISDMIRYNFPASAWKKDGLGDFSKRELSQDEIEKEMDCFEKGVNIGAVDMNDLKDLNTIRDKMGLEERSEIIKQPEPTVSFDENGNPVPSEAMGQDGENNGLENGSEIGGNNPAQGGEFPSKGKKQNQAGGVAGRANGAAPQNKKTD